MMVPFVGSVVGRVRKSNVQRLRRPGRPPPQLRLPPPKWTTIISSWPLFVPFATEKDVSWSFHDHHHHHISMMMMMMMIWGVWDSLHVVVVVVRVRHPMYPHSKTMPPPWVLFVWIRWDIPSLTLEHSYNAPQHNVSMSGSCIKMTTHYYDHQQPFDESILEIIGRPTVLLLIPRQRVMMMMMMILTLQQIILSMRPYWNKNKYRTMSWKPTPFGYPFINHGNNCAISWDIGVFYNVTNHIDTPPMMWWPPWWRVESVSRSWIVVTVLVVVVIRFRYPIAI